MADFGWCASTRQLGFFGLVAIVAVSLSAGCDDQSPPGAQLGMSSGGDQWPAADVADSSTVPMLDVTSGMDSASPLSPTDAGTMTGSSTSIDVGPGDVGEPDAGSADIAIEDVGPPDVGEPDVGMPDVGEPDVGDPDVGPEPDVFVAPTLGTPEDPAVDCLEIVSEWPDAPSGAYTFAFDSGPVDGYCDMDTYGGGWTLVSNRPYAPVPAAWGAFYTPPEGEPGPSVEYVLPFLHLQAVPQDVMLILEGLDDVLIEPVANDAIWEELALGARIRLSDGRYLVFADQAAAVNQAVCIAPGTYDTGFKCDGNDQIQHIQGMLSAFAHDELCNCGSHGYKTHVAGCEVAVCAPDGLVGVYLR